MKTPALFLLFSLVIPSISYAQKNESAGGEASQAGLFQSKSEYAEFMGNLKRTAQSDPELAAMIPLINDVVLGDPIGTTGREYKGTASSLGLLERPKVREELEMVDDQYKELQRLTSSIQSKAAVEIRNMDFSKVTNVATRIRGIQNSMKQDIEDLLLPHQLKRLKQLQNRSQLQRQSIARLLTSDPVKSELEISDEQSEELLEAEEDIEAELEKEIEQLREKAREKLLSKLKASQRQKAEELLGEDFDFSQPKEEKSKKKDGNKITSEKKFKVK